MTNQVNWKFNVWVLIGLLLGSTQSNAEQEGAVNESENVEYATFGAGCFWCTEAFFEPMEGVIDVVSGYSNGDTEDPKYKEVCSGTTGHAEVVRVSFDPAKVSYETLLDQFWKMHDPTTLNRQGADVGTQYRSGIFYHSEEQKAKALASREKVAANYKDPIVTEIVEAREFYPAEVYHQNYFRNNPNAPYSRFIQSKLDKFKK